MKKLMMALSAVGLFVMAAAPAQANVRSGVLTCRVAPSVSFVLGSQKALDCLFTSYRGRHEHYVGYISRFGVDLGFTSGGQMVWAVYAPTYHWRHRGALAGSYGGASAEATVGVGAGANVLVGGSGDSVSLQPLSVSTQQGLSAAATISGMELRPAGRRARRH